jgi:eukaryotic-like serine/threonine-protein kinase
MREVNPDVPAWLEEIVARLHAKNPADRFASAREVADLLARRLSELQASSGVRPVPEGAFTTPVASAPMGRGRRWAWITALLGLLIGLGVGGWDRMTRPTVEAKSRSEGSEHAPPPDQNPAPPARPQRPRLVAAPFDTAQARQEQDAWAAYLGTPLEVENSLGMKLRVIPPGEFDMRPNYHVRISRPFRLGATEVTIAQFRAYADDGGRKTDAEISGKGGGVMDRTGKTIEPNPEYTWRHPDVYLGDDYPVAQLSNDDATRYCEWLSRKEGKTYRLPTEAEWEWACRSGTVTAYYFGDDVAELDDYAWYAGNSDWHSHPVALKRPNAWGLFDMHGNVCEYCQDGYTQQLPAGQMTDPLRLPRAKIRVIRSYSFADPGEHLQSRSRASMSQAGSMFHFGFRVLCEIPE